MDQVSIYPHAMPHTAIERIASPIVNIYPLWSFHHCTKPPNVEKDRTIPERLMHRIANYNRVGTRTTVEGILVAHHNGHPYVLLLKIGDFHKLPGGRLRPGENEIEGLKRKLTSKLGCIFPQNVPNWQIGQCVATWWRPSYRGRVYRQPVPEPKECIKLFVVHLSGGMHIAEPKNLEIVYVSFLALQRQDQSYGTVISSIPEQLSGLRLIFIHSVPAVQNYIQLYPNWHFQWN